MAIKDEHGNIVSGKKVNKKPLKKDAIKYKFPINKKVRWIGKSPFLDLYEGIVIIEGEAISTVLSWNRRTQEEEGAIKINNGKLHG